VTTKDLGFRIRRLRAVRGLSQLALAKRAGVSQPHLWEVEAGQQPNPGIDFVERVAAALHVSVADLLDDSQATAEIGIFARFAAAAALGVRRESIVKRLPPEPDLRCVTRHGALAFELVQLVEEDIAQADAARLALKTQLLAAWTATASAAMADASIYVDFREDTTVRARKAAVAPIIQALRDLPSGTTGDVPIRRTSPLAPVVRRLLVSRRPHLSGPIFGVREGGPFANPPIQSVEAHFRTRYTADVPIELLVYYAVQPVIAQTWAHPELLAFITTELAGSPFRRVWIYDLASDSVLFVYPERSGRQGPTRRKGGT
jgi:transcriptional regulator with XRE-family HTH domain